MKIRLTVHLDAREHGMVRDVVLDEADYDKLIAANGKQDEWLLLVDANTKACYMFRTANIVMMEAREAVDYDDR